MKITKEKENSKTSIRQVEEFKSKDENEANHSKSKLSDSFCNLTDSQIADIEDNKGVAKNFKDEEYNFYFKGDTKIEEKGSEGEDDIDLEQFYENKQSKIEMEIMRRGSVSRSISNLNSMRKDSSRVSLTPKVNRNTSVTPLVDNNVKKRNTSLGLKKIAAKVDKLDVSHISRKSQTQMETSKRNTVNFISYDQFKGKALTLKPSVSQTPLNTSQINSSKFQPKVSQTNSLNRSASERKLQTNTITNTNIKQTTDKRRSTTKEKNINLKLKITHDTVEDITHTEDHKKNKYMPKSRSKSKSDPVIHVQKTLFDRKANLQVTNQQFINTFRRSTNTNTNSNNLPITGNIQVVSTRGSTQPVVLTTPMASNRVTIRENPISTISNYNSTSKIMITDANSNLEKEIDMLKSNNEKLDKEVKPLKEKQKREPSGASKKEVEVSNITNTNMNNTNLVLNDPITISDLQVEYVSRNEGKLDISASLTKTPSQPRVSQLTHDRSSENKEDQTRRMTLQTEVVTKSNVDENYEDEYKQIYVKRRATRASEEELNKVNEERKRKFFEELYHRNISWKKTVLNKSTLMKDELEVEKMKKCSFNPRVSKSNIKILSKSLNYANYDREDFYSKNIKWKQQVEKFKQTQHLINERREYEECFFQPVVNKKLLTESYVSEKKDQDHIYKKNMEWLRNVNEKRKLKDLELREEATHRSKRMSIRERMARSRSFQNLHTISNQSGHSEEKLRNDLTSNRSLRSPMSPTSPKFPSTFRTETFASQNFSTRDPEKDNIDKDIKELKYLISSLKTTLEENKHLYTLDDKSREENINYISINDSCNININIRSPSESMIKTFKRSNSTDRFRNTGISKRDKINNLKTSEDDEYSKKYKLLMHKYEKEKSREELLDIGGDSPYVRPDNLNTIQ